MDYIFAILLLILIIVFSLTHKKLQPNTIKSSCIDILFYSNQGGIYEFQFLLLFSSSVFETF